MYFKYDGGDEKMKKEEYVTMCLVQAIFNCSFGMEIKFRGLLVCLKMGMLGKLCKVMSVIQVSTLCCCRLHVCLHVLVSIVYTWLCVLG